MDHRNQHQLPESDATSVHVGRALEGDEDSLAWVITHVSPLLRMQVEYRLPERLRKLYDADDLVNDVWMSALPRLSTLAARDGRWTPVLLRYLGTAVMRRVNELYRKHLQGKPVQVVQRAVPDATSADPLAQLSASLTGALTMAAKNDAHQKLGAAIRDLAAPDREVVVLRGIEQLTNEGTATLLGEKPSTVAMRYKRALEKLRNALPGSVFDELRD